MKVIFLDIDGVLNSQQSCIYWNRRYKEGTHSVANGCMTLCPIACSNLQYVLEKLPDIKMILSSTWRLSDTWKEDLLNASIPQSILSKIIDVTSKKFSSSRGEEIRMYLNEHSEVEDFVIIDDVHWDMGEFRDDTRFVNTCESHGLTWFEAVRILKYFGVKVPIGDVL